MHALDVIDVHKIYRNQLHALKGVSFSVAEGDFFALLGPNGAGKSTLISIITTLCQKTRGQIKIFGYDLDREAERAKSFLGVVPQEFNFNPYDSVNELVLNQAGYYGVPRGQAKKAASQYLELLGLADKANKPVMTLSGGMKRRAMIARALVHQPKLLILDEPTAGVDIELRRSLWSFLQDLNKQGITIILTTHYLEEAESLCRNIAIINKGVILENTSMPSLLKTLDKESFIFYTQQAFTALPELPPQWQLKVLDDHSFELTVKQPFILNDLFDFLKASNIAISSMRNKTNRLEALFLDRVYEENNA